MPKVVCLGDTSDHGGTVMTSCQKHSFGGRLAARRGDLFNCPLHGVNPIATGSAKYTIEGQPVARDGDVTQCGAKLIATGKYSFA